MLANSEGQRVPQATFRTRRDGQWVDVSTDQIFKGRSVIVFALPGAYTPTCSTTHLPRYNELAATFSRLGVDEIVCLSVNDGFVMSEWQKDQDAPNVTFIPDGNGDFTAKMGMLVDKSELGFGKRSWRYSMLVRDGVVEKQFIEPQRDGDPFEVSDADTMLAYIAPREKAPEPAVIFSKPGCPHCARARATCSTATAWPTRKSSSARASLSRRFARSRAAAPRPRCSSAGATSAGPTTWRRTSPVSRNSRRNGAGGSTTHGRERQ